jgi:hypothetical protein
MGGRQTRARVSVSLTGWVGQGQTSKLGRSDLEGGWVRPRRQVGQTSKLGRTDLEGG